MRFVKSGSDSAKPKDNDLSDKTDEKLSKKQKDFYKKKMLAEKGNENELDNIVESKKLKIDENTIQNTLNSEADVDINKNVTASPFTLPLPPTLPPDATCTKIILNVEDRKKLEKFIIRQKVNESPLSVMQSSTSFCRISEEYVFEQQFTGEEFTGHTCSLYVGGVLVGKAFARPKKSAKYAAAFSALEMLRTIRPTILVTQPGDLNSALSRDDIATKNDSAAGQQISDTNLGNQLLRKMGWKGQGGLGKTGSGISEPVAVTETCGRQGLGVEDIGDDVISFSEADNVIRNYASSHNTDHLTFSPELTNPERAKIHKLAKKYGLRSKSYNKGNIRYLVVSRKMTAAALLKELKRSGGNIKGAQLIGPGQVKTEDSK